MAYFLYNRKSQEDEGRQVQSIDDQIKHSLELSGRLSLPIVECLIETMSAKRPGRPIFNAMITRIRRGEADGIIAWHPDRLCRNAVDAGALIDLLDTGALKDLKFCSYTFENTPEGKWMLGIVLSQSKYFVDKLSKDVKRGMNSKAEKGHPPFRALPGYLNDRNTRTIIADPERFDLIQQAMRLVVTGSYSAPQALKKLNDEVGFRTRRTNKTGGRPLARATFYEMLSNIYYTGQFNYEGKLYSGHHPPILTMQEFNQLQERLGKNKAQPQKREFAYTGGLLRCGRCGCQITAEQKVKSYKTTGVKRTYCYYHCSNARGICDKTSITEQEVEAQIAALLERVTLPSSVLDWCVSEVKEWKQEECRTDTLTLETLHKTLANAERRRSNLFQDRLSNPDVISLAEFKEYKESLDKEINQLKQTLLDREQQQQQARQTALNILDFSRNAKKAFEQGDVKMKQQIAQRLGKTYLLTLGKLEIQPHPLLAPILTFEPVKSGSGRRIEGYSTGLNPGWWRIPDAIRTLLRQPGMYFPGLYDAVKNPMDYIDTMPKRKRISHRQRWKEEQKYKIE